MTFGEKFKEQCLKSGLTSVELAEIFGVTSSTIRSMWRGKRLPNNMTVDDVEVMCQVFGTDYRYWLSDDIDGKVTVALTTKKYVLMKREGDIHE